VVAVTNGRLDFGPWEQILYGEIDGRRPRCERLLVKSLGHSSGIIGEKVAADHG
jgi:thiamine phosphate synthase YjbQ (UPF0047 family)